MTPAAASAGRLAPVSLETLPPYSPTTYVDFSQPAERAAFEKALAEVGAARQGVPARDRRRAREGGEKPFASTNPARPSEVLGTFQSAHARAGDAGGRGGAHGVHDLERACRAAERAAYLVEAAQAHARAPAHVLRVDGARGRQELGRGRRRHRRGDRLPGVLRARDAALRPAGRRSRSCPGEKDTLVYLPLGVGAVIPPWNFPLAICVGHDDAPRS